MKIYFLHFLLLFLTTTFSQDIPQRLLNLRKEYIRLDIEKKPDSIAILISKFEALPDLQPVEKQLILGYKASNYNTRGRYNDAINLLMKSLSFKSNDPYSIKISCNSYALLSDLNFTLKNYADAKKYALLCLKAKFIQQSATGYVNLHNIIGYGYFIERKYDLSLKEYAIAIKRAVKDQPCKIPEIYCKIAKVYARQNKMEAAKKIIDDGIKVSDSCGEKITKLNLLKALREIYTEKKQFKDANYLNNDIDDLSDDKTIIKRNSKIDSIETYYGTKLKEAQNKQLLTDNFFKNRQIVFQKRILVGILVGLAALLLLLYSIHKLSRKQKAINQVILFQKIEIESYNRNLERLNLLNQKIFSVIAHDFKGPITTLQYTLDKSKDVITGNQALQNYIEDISQQLTQSDAMLNNLLDWAKAELISTNSDYEKFDLYQIIIIAIAENKNKLIEKNITVLNNIAPKTIVQFNQAVLKIVLRNIINNSVKFSFENSEINIYFTNNTIHIKDYGKGIDPKKLTKLFTQNVNSGLGTNLESGFGMGLYLCYELMQKNNGNITALNNEERGTTFSIEI